VTGLAATAIKINPMLMGGGLGRKIEQDYVKAAIQTSKVIGKPVKAMYWREQDLGRDFYRPMAVSRVRLAFNASNQLTGISVRNVTPSIGAQRARAIGATGESSATEGCTARYPIIPNRLVEWVQHPSPIPVGYWRSVGHSFNAFIMETAIDEVAAIQGVDPYQLRRSLLAGDARSLAVLDAAASMGGWGTPVAAGRARGIAFANSFNTLVAQVVEISMPTATSIKVHSVACAVDCGFAMNPDSVIAQIQGGIIHGLSAALWGQVTFSKGVASAKNFNNYPAVRMKECPAITVRVINSTAAPSGVGEPGVPPLAPAVAGAYFKLTGIRQRKLPFFPGGGTITG
jgi:isoquinoline 1-oxidoreductase beta subunit